jgi:hypothetical protein
MQDDFGLINVMIPPFLERVSKEERLKENRQRKPRDASAKSHKAENDREESGETEDAGNSMSSQHIDLRI